MVSRMSYTFHAQSKRVSERVASSFLGQLSIPSCFNCFLLCGYPEGHGYLLVSPSTSRSNAVPSRCLYAEHYSRPLSGDTLRGVFVFGFQGARGSTHTALSAASFKRLGLCYTLFTRPWASVRLSVSFDMDRIAWVKGALQAIFFGFSAFRHVAQCERVYNVQLVTLCKLSQVGGSGRLWEAL